MLIIRAAQMKALDKAAEETFLAWVARDMERIWPGRFSAARASDGEARDGGASDAEARIAAGYRRAKGYGLRKKPQVAWFIQMDLLLGEEFERFPGLEWADRILRSELSPDTKVHRLTRRFEKAGININKAAGTQVRVRTNHGE